MKRIDKDSIDSVRGRKLETGDEFNFRCSPDVACYNKCCRNLNLFLYPYDVIRLRANLGITSSEFLDEYTDVVMREENSIPDVLLRMADNDEKTCPFLTDAGCSVYPDRPDTCRSFPVEQGLMFGDGVDMFSSKGPGPERVFFFRPPDFCRGQEEDELWTVDDWISDQEAEIFSTMTAKWAELKSLFSEDPWGRDGPYSDKAKMTFMAAYNVDDFRAFVFESSFLKRFKVKPKIVKKIKANDLDMLKLGFGWIKLFLWGIEGKLVKLKR